MKDENFYVIQGWMINKLKLSGNELLVYAVIYGFSQDDGSMFSGSRQYLADCCNCTVRSVQTTLNNLVEKKLITKYEENQNGVKYCYYVANFTGSENFSRGSENFSLNNINNNNLDNGKSKDLPLPTADDDFLQNFGKPEPKKQNLYQKCIALINDYTDIESIKTLLIQYLDFCMEIHSIRGANQWKGMLNTLDKVQVQCHPHSYEEIIRNSLDHGWKTFYPINDNYKQPGNVEGIKLGNAYEESKPSGRFF